MSLFHRALFTRHIFFFLMHVHASTSVSFSRIFSNFFFFFTSRHPYKRKKRKKERKKTRIPFQSSRLSRLSRLSQSRKKNKKKSACLINSKSVNTYIRFPCVWLWRALIGVAQDGAVGVDGSQGEDPGLLRPRRDVRHHRGGDVPKSSSPTQSSQPPQLDNCLIMEYPVHNGGRSQVSHHHRVHSRLNSSTVSKAPLTTNV